MTTVRRALALTLLERYLTTLLALASNVLLARLLTPEQIGIYSVSLAAIGIAHVLREFGIGNYLIQVKELSEGHIGTAFGLSLILGIGLFSILMLGAPYVAAFYGEASMSLTLRIVALNFLILPFATVAGALLRRDMHFKKLVPVALTAAAVSFIVTIALAWAGLGADSMAIGSVVQNALIGLGNWWVTPSRRIYRPCLREWRSVANFGGQTTFTNVITTASTDASDLVAGKVLGFESVAIMSRAQGLMNLFLRDAMNAVRAVAMPAFAQAARENQPVAARYLTAVSMISLVAWIFYGLVSIYALEALRLLFGPQWDVAAGLVPIYCAAGALACLTTLVPILLTAVGRIDLYTKAELAVQPFKLGALVAATLVFKDFEAVAWAFLTVTIASTPVFLWIADLGVGKLWRGLPNALWRSLAVALMSVLPAALHAGWAGFGRSEPLPLIEVMAAVVAGLLLAAITAELLSHPITLEQGYRQMRRRLRLDGVGSRHDPQ
jgi:lipopolysaccharide exporter